MQTARQEALRILNAGVTGDVCIYQQSEFISPAAIAGLIQELDNTEMLEEEYPNDDHSTRKGFS